MVLRCSLLKLAVRQDLAETLHRTSGKHACTYALHGALEAGLLVIGLRIPCVLRVLLPCASIRSKTTQGAPNANALEIPRHQRTLLGRNQRVDFLETNAQLRKCRMLAAMVKIGRHAGEYSTQPTIEKTNKFSPKCLVRNPSHGVGLRMLQAEIDCTAWHHSNA